MVRAGHTFVAGIHPPRTWMSGSLESVQWNACMHRLVLALCCHPKEWLRVRSEPVLTPTEKSSQPDYSKEGQTHDAASHRIASLTSYQLNLSSPWRWTKGRGGRGGGWDKGIEWVRGRGIVMDRGINSVRVGLVCWLLYVPATCECISGTDLLRQFYVLR